MPISSIRRTNRMKPCQSGGWGKILTPKPIRSCHWATQGCIPIGTGGRAASTRGDSAIRAPCDLHQSGNEIIPVTNDLPATPTTIREHRVFPLRASVVNRLDQVNLYSQPPVTARSTPKASQQ